MGVLFFQLQIGRILLTGTAPFGAAFQHCHWIQCSAPVIGTPVDVQIAAVLVAQLQQLCKMLIPLNGGYREVLRLKAPELLAVVEADEVGVIPEKFCIDGVFIIIIGVGNELALVGVIYNVSGRVVIRQMTLTAACRLYHTPYTFVCAGFQPGLGTFIPVLHHQPLVIRRAPIDGQRNVEHYIGLDILRNQSNDFCRICVIPGVDVHDQHGLIRGAGSAHDAVCRLCGHCGDLKLIAKE